MPANPGLALRIQSDVSATRSVLLSLTVACLLGPSLLEAQSRRIQEASFLTTTAPVSLGRAEAGVHRC